MPKLKAILWDNDGVLVDTEGLFYQANRELFAEHDIELTHQHFFDWFLMENLGAWHLLQARGMDDAQIAALRDQRNQRYAALLAETHSHVIDGIAEVLTMLLNGPAWVWSPVRVAITSNKFTVIPICCITSNLLSPRATTFTANLHQIHT